jgi:hypothetical protein
MPPGRNYLSTGTSRKYCDNAGDIPRTDHFAILEFSSITIPGDERSRSHPGHGYPESTERVVKYISFTDQAEWEEDVRRRVERHDNNFSAIKVSPAGVTVDVNIKIT